ncbi:hypothetical protein ACIS_00933 [Anaplasma centrale str. Israel]|uniref:Uncharacterized protein n=2 Tax=Anaplasma centrale TaxID=769 RepID=D1ASI9_ANACI|nr:hypothetical protein ACIS_00933 [Anaplasma centrale str. Israel]
MVLLVMMGGGDSLLAVKCPVKLRWQLTALTPRHMRPSVLGSLSGDRSRSAGIKRFVQELREPLSWLLGIYMRQSFPEYSIVTGVPENVRAGILMGTIEDIMSVARDIALNACNSLKLAAPSATLDGILCTQTPRDDAAHVAGMPRTEHSRAEERRQELERRHKKICASIARTLVSIAGNLYEIRHPGQDIVIGVPEDVRAAVLVGTLFYIASDAIGIAWDACLSLRGAGPSATLDDILFAPAQQAQGAAL